MKLEFYKQAIEKSPSIVVITNINGEFVYVNPKFTQVTGYTLEEILGKKTSILKSGELSKEYYEKMWNTLLKGEEWKGEFHNVKKNGELYWISSSISSIKDNDGKIIRFIAVQEEITKMKAAQERIDQLSRFQNLILNTIPNGIVIFDTNGKILFSNKSMMNLTLFNEFELDLANFLELVDSSGLIGLIINKFDESDNIYYESELNLIPKRGEPFPVRVIIAQVTKKERYLAVIHDLSTEKRSEKIIEEFQSLIANETYLSVFCQSKIGPEIYLSDDFPFSKSTKDVLATKIGVYFSTAIGQGADANAGLFGPLPFPDNPGYESIVYTSFLIDDLNVDPRSHGRSYCLFVVTFPKNLGRYFANRQYLTKIFEKFITEHNNLREIEKYHVEELKLSLIK